MFSIEEDEDVCSFCCKNTDCTEYEKISCVILNNRRYDDVSEDDLINLFP
jgi:hypothetical protein